MANTRIMVTIPLGELPFWKQVFRALDPDTGGAESFVDMGDGNWAASIPVSQEKFAQFEAIKADQVKLLDYAQQTNARRFIPSIKSKIDGSISVKDFGAIADGVMDDSAAFIAARAAANGRSIYAPAGTYKLNKAITGSTDLVIHGDGDTTVLDFTGAVTGGNYALEAKGTAKQIESVSGTQAAGSYSVLFASPPSLSVGDVFVIYNPTDYSWSGFRPYYRAGEWCQVIGISGNTVSINSRLYDTYDAANVNVYRISGPRLVLRDFAIKGTTVLGLTSATFCINPILENVTATHANNSAVYMDRCYMPTVINPNMSNIGGGGDDYGISIGNSQHARVIGGTVYARRHATASGGSGGICSVPNRDFRIIGSLLKNDHSTNIHTADFHGNTEDSSYINCTIFGGSSWQGSNVEFVNCVIYSDLRGRVISGAEIKGGKFSARGCTFVTDANPSTYLWGVINVGQQGGVITANTVLPATFVVENCTLNGRNFSANTSFLSIANDGSTVKISAIVDGLVADVNAMGSILRTALISGAADSDGFVVDRVSKFPPGTYLHAAVNADYAGFPHRCQRQGGNQELTATIGTPSTLDSVRSFRYIYPRSPAIQCTTIGGVAGNRPVVSSANEITSSTYKLQLQSPDLTNWTSTLAVRTSWVASMDEL